MHRGSRSFPTAGAEGRGKAAPGWEQPSGSPCVPHVGWAPCSTLGQVLNISFFHFSGTPHLPGLFEHRSSRSKGPRYWREALDGMRVSEEMNHSGKS